MTHCDCDPGGYISGTVFASRDEIADLKKRVERLEKILSGAEPKVGKPIITCTECALRDTQWCPFEVHQPTDFSCKKATKE